MTEQQKAELMALVSETVYHEICFFIKKQVRNDALAEDITQDVFMGLLKQDQKSVRNPRAWLYRAAHNRIVDVYRRNQKGQEIMDDILSQSPQFNETSSLNCMIQKEDAEILLRSIDELPLSEREVIRLRFYESFKLEEIAEIMGLTRAKVRTLLSHALQHLRTCFGGANA